MKLEKNGQPISTLAEWQRVAGPKSADQWSKGRSAYECANAWCVADSIVVPAEIRALLDSHPDTSGCDILSGIPEHQVRFDSLPGEPRNADMVLLAAGSTGRIAISVEAKADEPFGEYVGDVLADAIDKTTHGEKTNVVERVEGLASMLPTRVPRSEKLGSIRYQLLTAVAGALAFAEANEASAVLIVHEFQTEKTTADRLRANGHDLDVFARRLSSGSLKNVVAGKLYGPFPIRRPGSSNLVKLYLGKAVR